MAVSQASLWNEGKLHLGLIFAKDRASRTARTLALGSLHFDTGLRRWGVEVGGDDLSEPFTYAVHRRSMVSVGAVEEHFAAVEREYGRLRRALGLRYLGDPAESLFERLTDRELRARFEPKEVSAGFATVERSVDPERVAERVRAALAAEPRVRFLGGRHVRRVRRDGDGTLEVEHADWPGQGHEVRPYRHVVNALWRDRLRVDAELGLHPRRPWLFRYKLALHVKPSRPLESTPSSTTLLLGPFGDVVNFGGRRLYLSWYPACRLGSWQGVSEGGWKGGVGEEVRRRVFDRTLARLGEVIPGLSDAPIAREDTSVEGGVIFNWGKTDITDPASEVHERWDIGVHSRGGYHSIDTGKYCMAPLFALQVAERITSDRRAPQLA